MKQVKELVLDKKIRYVLTGLFFFLPFERIPSLDFHGYTIKISYLFVLLLFILMTANLSKFRSMKLSKSDLVLLVFWLYSFVLAFFAPEPGRGVVIAAMWAFVFLAYLVLVRVLRDHTLRKRAEDVVLIASLATCLFGIYQFLGDSYGLPVSMTGLRYAYTKAIFGFPRIQSVGLEPLYFGNFLLVPIYIAIKRYTAEKAFLNKYWYLLVLIFVVVILGIARGVYIAFLISFAVFLVYLITRRESVKYYRGRALGLIIALSVAVFLSLAMINFFNGKEASGNFVGHAGVDDVKQGESVPARIVNFKRAIELLGQKPLTGFGPGSYGVISTTPEQRAGGLVGVVNNEYLEIAAETGLIGLILFFWFILLNMTDFVRAAAKMESRDQVGLVAVFLGVVAVFVQYNFFSTLYVLHIWVFLALLKAMVGVNCKTAPPAE